MDETERAFNFVKWALQSEAPDMVALLNIYQMDLETKVASDMPPDLLLLFKEMLINAGETLQELDILSTELRVQYELGYAS